MLTTTWTDLGSHLDAEFERLAELTKRSVPELIWRSGRADNEAFPFRAYATFRGPSKVIDLSVDCKLVERSLRIDADIAEENGLILAEFPTVEVPIDLGERETDKRIRLAIVQIERFFRRNLHLIVEGLGHSSL